MPHNIIDKANCTIAKATDLRNYSSDLMSMQGDPPEGAEALLERVETFFTMLCDGTALTGGDTLDGLLSEIKTLLGI